MPELGRYARVSRLEDPAAQGLKNQTINLQNYKPMEKERKEQYLSPRSEELRLQTESIMVTSPVDYEDGGELS